MNGQMMERNIKFEFVKARKELKLLVIVMDG